LVLMTETAPFPTGWLAAGKPVADLDLALLLVNSLDLLEDPADRLHDLTWLRSAYASVGHRVLANQLRSSDVVPLRSLRDGLRPAFTDDDPKAVAHALNPLLAAAPAPVLVQAPDEPDRLRFAAGHGLTGYAALAARLPAAVAAHLAANGVGRLGSCAADPCRCVFVDRSRAGTRRFCCDYCNDRAAARAYRRRRSHPSR
jgi:predicted RNA-binding Zn ribbon-like protein